jgi:hypothetical protein
METPASTPDRIEWSIHPAGRAPGKAACVVVIIAFAIVASVLLMGQWVAGLFAFLCLLGSTSDFLFPVRFSLTEEGVRVRGWGSDRGMKWEMVRRVTCGEGRIHLSPFSVPTRLDRFRGLELRFDPSEGELQERVLRRIQVSIPSATPDRISAGDCTKAAAP